MLRKSVLSAMMILVAFVALSFSPAVVSGRSEERRVGKECRL